MTWRSGSSRRVGARAPASRTCRPNESGVARGNRHERRLVASGQATARPSPIPRRAGVIPSQVMTRCWLVPVISLMLAACAHGASVRVFTGPDGKADAYIKCRDRADCLETAGNLCPRGYDVVTSGSEVTGSKTTAAAPTPGLAFASTSVSRENDLMISCPGLGLKRAAAQHCGYTCGPQPRTCPWLDDNGCVKPGHEVPGDE